MLRRGITRRRSLMRSRLATPTLAGVLGCFDQVGDDEMLVSRVTGRLSPFGGPPGQRQGDRAREYDRQPDSILPIQCHFAFRTTDGNPVPHRDGLASHLPTTRIS